MKNIELAQKVIQELINTGIREFVLCAGARNSPFIHILNECKDIKIYSFFEERSAAFFAIGRIASTRRPVAIFTTSGTAAAELLPATIEATYSSVPLILVTSDRPRKHRGSGAPQSIEQIGLYSYYTEVSIDLDDENSHISFKNLSWKKPIHVNVCFNEPLLDAPIPELKVPQHAERVRLPEQLPLNLLKDVDDFLETRKPLIIIGFLPERAHKTVLDFLTKYQAPVYAESISGLRGHPQIENLLLKSGEKMAKALVDRGVCDSILRIGGVPTLRLWRDLEEKYKHLPVLSISYNHFTGLSREVKHFSTLEIFSQLDLEHCPKLTHELLIEDQKKSTKLQELFLRYPQAEPALIGKLSEKLARQSVYLGNSLPIREWDLAASYNFHPRRIVANRGANGIDGQLSSFLGWADTQSENWCVVGDLTALYDLSAPWAFSQMDPLTCRFVIINNKGGQIFKRMFQKDIFLNRHNISFNHWAAMWEMGYMSWTSIPERIENLSEKMVIELLPDVQQTELFWNEWENCWSE